MNERKAGKLKCGLLAKQGFYFENTHIAKFTKFSFIWLEWRVLPARHYREEPTVKARAQAAALAQAH